MTEEPASLILELLRQMRAELATKADLEGVRSELTSEIAGARSEVAEVKSDMHSLRADVASDLLSTRKELSEQIVGLRRAVIEYHTSVIGHGVLIRELEARMRRVEQHLNLPSLFPA
jgi:chromosome segregation ATPase